MLSRQDSAFRQLVAERNLYGLSAGDHMKINAGLPPGFLFAFLGGVIGARNRRPDEEAEFEQRQFRAYIGHGVDDSVAHD